MYAGWLYGSEIPELKVLQGQFTAKYGQAYAQEVIQNKEKYLNHRLVRMLTSTQARTACIIYIYNTYVCVGINIYIYIYIYVYVYTYTHTDAYICVCMYAIENKKKYLNHRLVRMLTSTQV